ncbi:hypothetical protein SAMN05216480_10416 [Pustulibacterium marinum]|uniref:Uncharacterized protein n=1 Tax=Pustulibacterium marinum TaxID=1224947 RepID=A0A1I7G9Z2_9FLAO|nr:hypothetical protein [Pustulibacterium marinum]SFU45275.1 hypothetical protein SAMN05216480_10416 [Pustulibacterium marinum]
MNAHTQKAKKRTIILAIWTAAWLISLAFVSFSSELNLESHMLTLAATLVNLIIGLGMIWANRNYIKNLDELQKKIQLDAMAATLGIAVVVGLSYSLLDINNIIPFDAEISHLVFLIGITYAVGIAIGAKKYQ